MPCSRLSKFSGASARPEEGGDVAGELGVVLEQEPVRRVRTDLHLRLRDQTGEQVGEVRQDHRIAVAISHDHRHADRTDPLQLTVVRDAPLAHGATLKAADTSPAR